MQTMDYDYLIEGRRRPDPLPKLIAAHEKALSEANHTFNRPAVLIGKSMGSRIGCHLSLQEKVRALICLGYPLCAGGDPTRLRDKVLRELSAPILFVQGTRDPLCPLDLLQEVRAQMTANNQLHVIEGGDHSLRVGKKQLHAGGQTQESVDRNILEVIRKFTDSIVDNGAM